MHRCPRRAVQLPRMCEEGNRRYLKKQHAPLIVGCSRRGRWECATPSCTPSCFQPLFLLPLCKSPCFFNHGARHGTSAMDPTSSQPFQQSEGDAGRSYVKCDFCRERHKKVGSPTDRPQKLGQLSDAFIVLAGITNLAWKTLHCV